MFIVFPAIDLRQGHCVRLKQGRLSDITFYSQDPAAVAEAFREAGASWVHVVNLDGALEGDAEGARANLLALRKILEVQGLRVQFGGGVRTLEAAERLLELGVSRVVLGTALVRNPLLGREAAQRLGAERLVAAVDSCEGKVVARGWQEVTSLSTSALARQLASCGLKHVLYTNVHRDGMLSGADLEGAVALAEETGLQVILSGGVSSVEDVAKAASAFRHGVSGIVIGKALYEGFLSLQDALRAARERIASLED